MALKSVDIGQAISLMANKLDAAIKHVVSKNPVADFSIIIVAEQGIGFLNTIRDKGISLRCTVD